MSISIEYNFPEDSALTMLNLFKGINLQLINEEHKLVISPISAEDYQQVIPNTPCIIIQMALPNIELVCILNLSTHSAEIVGKRVFCQMFSFEDLIAYYKQSDESTCRYINDIIFMPCIQNHIQNTDENASLNKFFIFCGTIIHLLSPLIEKAIHKPELLKSIFNEAFGMI